MKRNTENHLPPFTGSDELWGGQGAHVVGARDSARLTDVCYFKGAELTNLATRAWNTNFASKTTTIKKVFQKRMLDKHNFILPKKDARDINHKFNLLKSKLRATAQSTTPPKASTYASSCSHLVLMNGDFQRDTTGFCRLAMCWSRSKVSSSTSIVSSSTHCNSRWIETSPEVRVNR